MNIYEKFQTITGISIKNFYEKLTYFYDNYHQSIVNYYTDYYTPYPLDAFTKYKQILTELEKITTKLTFYKENFETVDIWDWIDQLDDIKIKLDSVPAYPRLYKVNFYKKQTDLDKNTETYVMKTHDTIESVARNYNQDIDDLVLINELQEEHWTDKGGVKLLLKSSISEIEAGGGIKEDVVFDVLMGKNILGKDLPPYFEINEEDEDLVVMTPEQTFLEGVKTLFQLKQGEIPENPEIGINKNVIAECTRGNMAYTFPIMLRQLNLALNTDDTILRFEITDIQLDPQQSTYQVFVEVQNRLLDNLKFATTLQ